MLHTTTTRTHRASRREKLGLLSALLLLPLGCAWDVDESGAFREGDVALDEKAIVGGTDSEIEQHPWQVSLRYPNGDHFCGGSIIAAEWILTAQHCVEGSSPSDLRVVAGASSVLRGGVARTVAEIIHVPGYSSPEFGKDVSLLRLSSPLSLGGAIQAIGLVTPEQAAAGATSAGVSATVSGWGRLSSGGDAPVQLQAVTLPLLADSVPAQRYGVEGIQITSDQLAAAANGRDSCQGDSGGPLTVAFDGERRLAGVVSWGFGCADPRFPGMYARVSSFAAFIEQHTGIGGGQAGPIEPVAAETLLDVVGLSRAEGAEAAYSITVPAGTKTLDVVLSGGSGDADLYVRRGAAATQQSYDCRPYKAGNEERCSFMNPTPGQWNISVHAYSAFAGVQVAAVARDR